MLEPRLAGAQGSEPPLRSLRDDRPRRVRQSVGQAMRMERKFVDTRGSSSPRPAGAHDPDDPKLPWCLPLCCSTNSQRTLAGFRFGLALALEHPSQRCGRYASRQVANVTRAGLRGAPVTLNVIESKGRAFPSISDIATIPGHAGRARPVANAPRNRSWHEEDRPARWPSCRLARKDRAHGSRCLKGRLLGRLRLTRFCIGGLDWQGPGPASPRPTRAADASWCVRDGDAESSFTRIDGRAPFVQ